jgi:hypothetical protein
VVTRVSFTPNKQFEMAFEIAQYLSNKEAEVVLPLLDNGQTRTILGTVPDARALAPPAAAPAKEKVDTGLLEAFGAEPEARGNGQSTPARRGRPAKDRAVPQTIENAPFDPPPQQARPATKAAPVEDQLESDTFEESDSDLDDTVAKLMGDKMNKMMK